MIGQTISHYRILEKLGEGGMGVVYKALDLRLGRLAALKFLPPHLTQDEENKRRLVNEARTVSALDHPNICTLYELGETADGQMFIAMAYYDGLTIKQKIRNERLALDDILDATMAVANGLAEAHKKGITHRDIKSDNIIVTDNAVVKIMDFGIASIIGTDTRPRGDAPSGTTPYMSPEQARGEPIDHRSDIWSLGVVIYEMVTGGLPFRDEFQEGVVHALLYEEPEPAATRRPDVPEELVSIINKCLQKDPGKRYQKIGDLIADVQQMKDDRQEASLTYSRQRRRRRAVVIVAVAFTATLMFALNPRWVPFLHQEWGKRHTLAVGPFDNIAEPRDSGHLGEMITTLLMTSLSQSSNLNVVSRERLSELKKIVVAEDSALSPAVASAEAAKRSGATAMLVGRIVEQDPLEIAYQLIDIGSGNLIRAGSCTADPSNDTFSLVDSISHEAAAGLGVNAAALSKVRPVTEVTTASLEAYRAYVEGDELAERAYPRQAAAAYKRAIELDSNFALAQDAYASYGSNIGLADARRAQQKAWELRDRVTERERLMIEARFNAWVINDHVKAASVYEEVVRKYPATNDAYVQLCLQYSYMFESDKLLATLRQAAIIDAGDRDIWNSMAYAYASVNERDSAMYAARRALMLRPAFSDAYDSYGDMYAYFGDLDSADIFYEKARSLRPDLLSSEKHACLKTLQGDYAAARKSVLTGNQYDQAPNVWYFDGIYLGQALIDLHRGRLRSARRKAEADFARGKREGPTKAVGRARWIIGLTSFELGDWQRMISLDGNSKSMTRMRAWGLVASGKAKEALALVDSLYDQAAPKDRRTEAIHSYDLGIIAFHSGRYDLAVEDFGKAVSLLPPNRFAFYFYGVSLLKAGKIAQGIEELKLATWKYPFISAGVILEIPQFAYWPISAVKAHYWLGVAYETQGNLEKAAKEYGTFLRTWKIADFDSPELHDAKRRLAALGAI